MCHACKTDEFGIRDYTPAREVMLRDQENRMKEILGWKSYPLMYSKILMGVDWGFIQPGSVIKVDYKLNELQLMGGPIVEDMVGCKVRLTGTYYLPSRDNPVWGSEYECEGTVLYRTSAQIKVRWDNGRVNGGYEMGRDLTLIKVETNAKPMLNTVSKMMKKLLDADTQSLIKAGFIDTNLELTANGKTAIWGILFDAHKAQLVEAAKEVIAEAEKKD